MTSRDDLPSIREIAELTARLRRLSTAGRDADPAERAAFLVEKDALLARIEESARDVPSRPVEGDRSETAEAVSAAHQAVAPLTAAGQRSPDDDRLAEVPECTEAVEDSDVDEDGWSR